MLALPHSSMDLKASKSVSLYLFLAREEPGDNSYSIKLGAWKTWALRFVPTHFIHNIAGNVVLGWFFTGYKSSVWHTAWLRFCSTGAWQEIFKISLPKMLIITVSHNLQLCSKQMKADISWKLKLFSISRIWTPYPRHHTQPVQRTKIQLVFWCKKCTHCAAQVLPLLS